MDRHVASMNDIQLNDTNTYTFDERRESILKANGEKRFQEIFDNYMKLEYDEISEIEHEYRLIDNHGNPIVVKEYVRTVKNSKNKPIQMIGLITDVTAQKEQLKKIHDLAYIDPITGYRNRFALTEDYNTKLKNGFGLLMKLDNYTDVIKYCGYGYADKFSKEMMAKNYLGTSPLISKYKLTYNTFFYYSTAPLNEVINTVSTMLKNINVHHTIGNKMIDLKFRVVILEDIHDNIDDFLREIEYSYTICQDLDKDLVFADEDLLKEYRIKKNFEDLIRKAIANDEFFPYFQPKADVNTGKTYGAEALARWMLDGEIIPPIEFIPYLESVGLISDLDLMIMNKAMHQAKEWIDNKIVDDDFRISFNLSIDTVEKTDLISLIDQAVVDIGIGYHNIEMEVTETMVVTDSDKVLNELRGLKGRGVTISIDDFSAGNSSLVSICKFPCDIIKIDSKLLWSVEDSPINQEVISLVSALGKRIEKKIICEGVENLNQKRILEAEGVELAQGYYYAKPLSPKDFIDFITKDVQ
jgi:EAL domain-containing protein (putative c-di-GMP-specific phosphodiesterase class I)/GGDEF domain-containing protein